MPVFFAFRNEGSGLAGSQNLVGLAALPGRNNRISQARRPYPMLYELFPGPTYRNFFHAGPQGINAILQLNQLVVVTNPT